MGESVDLLRERLTRERDAARVEADQLRYALQELFEAAEESWPDRPCVVFARSVLAAWPPRNS